MVDTARKAEAAALPCTVVCWMPANTDVADQLPASDWVLHSNHYNTHVVSFRSYACPIHAPVPDFLPPGFPSSAQTLSAPAWPTTSPSRRRIWTQRECPPQDVHVVLLHPYPCFVGIERAKWEAMGPGGRGFSTPSVRRVPRPLPVSTHRPPCTRAASCLQGAHQSKQSRRGRGTLRGYLLRQRPYVDIFCAVAFYCAAGVVKSLRTCLRTYVPKLLAEPSCLKNLSYLENPACT